MKCRYLARVAMHPKPALKRIIGTTNNYLQYGKLMHYTVVHEDPCLQLAFER